MPGPGLVVTCGYGCVPRLSPVGDTELSALQVDTDAGPVRYGYREMKRGCSSALGNDRPVPARSAIDVLHPNPRA